MDPTHPSLSASASWSVLVRDAETDEVVLEQTPAVLLSAASAPKLLLLVACAALIERGELDPRERLERASVPPVGDSGLWQHLDQPTLTVADAALLVGAVSDNLATNVLLERIGLDAVARECDRLGIRDVHLHDAVRDVRGAGDAPRLSSASAAGMVELMARLAGGTLGAGMRDRTAADPAALGATTLDRRVLGWMRHSVDLSMVASAFGLDPLAHGATATGIDGEAQPPAVELFVKTGTDVGVRADVGIVRTPRRTLVYAAIANWVPAPGAQDAVLASMRAIGEQVRAAADER